MFSILTIIHFVAWEVLLTGVSAEVQELIQHDFRIHTLMQLPDPIIILRITSCLQKTEMEHRVDDTATTIYNNLPAFRTTTSSSTSSSNVGSVDSSGQDHMDASDELVSDWMVVIFYHVYTSLPHNIISIH